MNFRNFHTNILTIYQLREINFKNSSLGEHIEANTYKIKQQANIYACSLKGGIKGKMQEAYQTDKEMNKNCAIKKSRNYDDRFVGISSIYSKGVNFTLLLF